MQRSPRKRKRRRGSMRQRPDAFVRASAVTITKADGSTVVHPAMTPSKKIYRSR